MVESVDDKGVFVVAKGAESKEHIAADTVIVAAGFKPGKSMLQDLIGLGLECYEVGDGQKVGDVYTTIKSAFEVARRV